MYFGEYLNVYNDELSTAATKLHDSMEDRGSGFVQEAQKAASRLSEEDRTELFNDSAGEQMILDSLRQIMSNSMFISAHAHFEESLKGICQHIESQD